MKKTKIDWCDVTLNPVVGCKNNCPYCYAKKLNDRFHFVENWNEPQFFPERLKELNSKKPKSIFMNSMSDIMYWKEEWSDEVIKAIIKNPQHNYIFLTKGIVPNPYDPILAARKIIGLGVKCKNVFVGKTMTNENNILNIFESFAFLSIEPILGQINLAALEFTSFIKQVIIGAETGNRKDKVIPKKEWVDNIVKQCDKAGIRVFMKSSLKNIMGKDFRQDPLIWDVDKH